MPKIISTLILLLTFFACSESYEGATSASVDNYDYEETESSLKQEMDLDQVTAPSTSPPPPAGESAELPKIEQAGNRKIIYTAEARMRVDSLEDALARINRIVELTGGFLSNQEMRDDTYRKTATLTLRLPVNNFTGSVNRILEIGNFLESQSLNSMDVSTEWLDLESRLATKREVRDRYIDILRKRAKKVEDILAAEDKIRRITEEIEAKEGRLRYLRDQVSMSTFTLSIYETQEVREVPPTYVRHFGHEIMDALGNGLYIIKGLLLGVLSIWPLLLLVVPVVWVYRKWKR